jgi:hypothetical protein
MMYVGWLILKHMMQTHVVLIPDEVRVPRGDPGHDDSESSVEDSGPVAEASVEAGPVAEASVEAGPVAESSGPVAEASVETGCEVEECSGAEVSEDSGPDAMEPCRTPCDVQEIMQAPPKKKRPPPSSWDTTDKTQVAKLMDAWVVKLPDMMAGVECDQIHLLGEGAFGRVYKLGTKAVKIQLIKDGDKNSKSSVMNELTFMSRVRCSTCVYATDARLFEIDSSIKLSVLVMPCATASLRDLPKYLKEYRNYRWYAALNIFSALECIHAEGMYHLDVKPGNILVYFEGGVPCKFVLSDYGLSVPAKTRVDPTMIVTTAYRCPELLQGFLPEHMDRCDVFAACQSMFEMDKTTPLMYFDALNADTDIEVLMLYKREMKLIPTTLFGNVLSRGFFNLSATARDIKVIIESHGIRQAVNIPPDTKFPKCPVKRGSFEARFNASVVTLR